MSIKQIIATLLLLGAAGIASLEAYCQSKSVTLSGKTIDGQSKMVLPFVNIVLKSEASGAFVAGTITNEEGIFTLSNVKSGKYILATSVVGYQASSRSVLVGQLSDYLDLGVIPLQEDQRQLDEVKVVGQQEGVAAKMDKKVFTPADNLSQAGGSVLQVLSNLPGITTQDGVVQLRGSDKVVVLIDGKQTALTGFGSQKGLDNLPASAIEKIEIINNPSAKYDANGNAGIINIVFKKNEQYGWNGKVGLAAGAGALWRKHESLPTVRRQFQATPKINPSFSLNHRRDKANVFVQGDWLYSPTLNKNEFATRIYDTGEKVVQQIQRNRTTTYATIKTGVDYTFNAQNSLTVSGLFNREKILDDGDNPYFLGNDYTNRYRMWQFLEDEVKYTAMATAVYVHKFKQPGRLLNINYNYTFHREDEKYFYTNTLPTSTGTDSFKLLSDEQVQDLNVDYTKPLLHGKLETGLKLRRRSIPVNMQFFPGANSVLDVNAGGWANYYETIPALYGNYSYENDNVELEGGLRMEYVQVNYKVNPNHNTYKSDGYNYTQPFPNVRVAYKLNPTNKLSLFVNRRVDRPNEVDIRIFPKYDEPELIKVGNPTLKPQFTTSMEVGYKTLWPKGSFYTAVYHRITDGTITRITTQAPGSVLLYTIFQNIGRSWNTGMEVVWQQELGKKATLNASATIYQNKIDAYTITNKYPVPTTYVGTRRQMTSGNLKINLLSHLGKGYDLQVTSIYLAPDLLPQGRIEQRFTLDMGLKRALQNGKKEFFVNATDLLNTMKINRTIYGAGFTMHSTDYYETQVIRVGYNQKF